MSLPTLITCYMLPPIKDRLFQSPRARFFCKNAYCNPMGRKLPTELHPDIEFIKEKIIDPENYVCYFLHINKEDQYIICVYDEDDKEVVNRHEVIGYNIEEHEEHDMDCVDLDFAWIEVDDPKKIKKIDKYIKKLAGVFK